MMRRTDQVFERVFEVLGEIGKLFSIHIKTLQNIGQVIGYRTLFVFA
jgi:hypothetical protein